MKKIVTELFLDKCNLCLYVRDDIFNCRSPSKLCIASHSSHHKLTPLPFVSFVIPCQNMRFFLANMFLRIVLAKTKVAFILIVR